MGPHIQKFYFLDGIIDPWPFRHKILTNDVEAAYSQAGKRRINLIREYITLAKWYLLQQKLFS